MVHPRRFLLVFCAIAFAMSAPGCGDEPGDDEIPWEGEEVAPRGVAALGGEGQNLVRFSPAPWADDHRVEASRVDDFDELEEVSLAEEGAAVHGGLTAGQEWFYRVVAIGDEGREVTSPVVSATPTGNELLSLYVEMDPDDLAELYERDPRDDDRLDARLFVGASDGPEVEVEGIRFRGSTTRLYDKKGFNIRLEDRPELEDYPNFNFRSDDRRAGNRLALNALWTDPTAMREALNFEMYDELGVIAPTYYFTELYFNGVFEGLYIGLERIDREAIRRWGLNRSRGEFTMVRDESKSYRQEFDEISSRSIFGTDAVAAFGSEEAAIEAFKEIFRYRGETEDQNWEGLLELVQWVHATPAGATYEQGFREQVDVQNFIDFVAVHVLTHDRDSFDIDFWLYRDDAEDADDGRWKFIPWDKNLTFGHHYFGGFRGVNDFLDYDRDFINYLGNDLIRKALASPGIRAEFDERLHELVTEVFTDQWFADKMAQIADEIAPAMARIPDEGSYEIHPGQHHGELGWWESHQRALKDFVRLRRAYVLHYLGEEEESVASGAQIIDEDGWTVAEFVADDGSSVEWSVDLVELDEEDRRIDREWIVDVSQPTSGEMTLYWRHTPWESWYGELVMPGQLWYLDAFYEGDDGEWQRVEGEVLPFANKITFPVELEGQSRWRIGYVVP